MNICKRTIIVAAGAAVAAVVKDTGSFRTYRFALTPNQFIQGRHIRSVVTGRVDGSYSFAFFASTTPHAFIVPGSSPGRSSPWPAGRSCSSRSVPGSARC
jgi:hypothetical protein